MYTDDPLRDFERWDAERERRLMMRPTCADCGEHIQDDMAYRIGGEWLCTRCIDCYLTEVHEDCGF